MGISIFQILKKFDLFGREIKLNFTDNEYRGPHFRTVIGGMMSLALSVLMIVYLEFLIDKMYGYKEDAITSIERKLNRTEMSTVSYKHEMDIIYIFRFYHSETDKEINYDEAF